MIAVQGPNARAKVWQRAAGQRSRERGARARSSAPQVGDLFIARTGYTGEDGFEIMMPAARAAAVWEALAAAGVAPCGLGARDTLRLEAGMNLYGQDMDETVSPLDVGPRAGPSTSRARATSSARRRCSRIPPTRSSSGLLLLDAGGVLRAHQKVQTPHGDGEITSGTFSPTLGKSIALARAAGGRRRRRRRDAWRCATSALAARVVKPPFVRNGKVLVT